MDYKSTLNLPQTDFPMKADLPKREPEILKRWQSTHLYDEILKKNAGRPKFILHDGPPYANGNIHFGHILNKVLKDFIIKYQNMRGSLSPYIPGWDCHGLPIEHQVDKDLGPKKKTMSKVEIRKACREYAARFVKIQRGEFERLGVFGRWDRPYLTMSPVYEGTIAREFSRFVAQGNIYKGKKPVLWCCRCKTALAEAETEYEEHTSPSIYVKFPLRDDLGDLSPKLKGKKVSVVIWTTTPWTLPANLAVALHPQYDYVVIPFQDEFVIVAKNLLENFAATIGFKTPEPVERFSGKKLERKNAQHPFLSRPSLIILSDHVTIDTGTGAVHTAPGHGEEDFVVGKEYGLEPLTPVDGQGRFTEECGVPEWVGQDVFKTNPQVIELLQKKGNLLKSETIRHNYPHCWRCKNPLIFRATEQWFLSLEKNDLRQKSIDAIRRTNWIPQWGRDRILGMIQNRPDWCLSRQRSWGVPIIAFRCSSCEYLLLDADLIGKIADRMEKEGSDFWFEESVEKLLSPSPTCPKGHNDWQKEEDILDVWFDSGISFAAVLEKESTLHYPADLYLEGSDQHRGWFHSSLLASIGTRGQAPYQTVLTHGFVVDGEGKKYSKSAGNYVPPEKILNEYGAEILRLWVAAEDYRTDIRVSDEILKRLIEAYRKIRNTARFLLANLYDFNPNQMGIKQGESEIDLWMLHTLQKLIQRVRAAYEGYNFHIIFHELNRFCTVDLSSFYLDIIKDRLYVSAKEDPARRAVQSVLFEVVGTLARLMAPVLSYTAEEIWNAIPAHSGKASSVHLTAFPESRSESIDESLESRWNEFRKIREEVQKALENARAAKKIGSPLEAKVVLMAEGEPKHLLKKWPDPLPMLFIVSQVEWAEELPETAFRSESYPVLQIEIQKAEGEKCSRCWNWSVEVGLFPDHPLLCRRCHQVISNRS